MFTVKKNSKYSRVLFKDIGKTDLDDSKQIIPMNIVDWIVLKPTYRKGKVDVAVIASNINVMIPQQTESRHKITVYQIHPQNIIFKENIHKFY